MKVLTKAQQKILNFIQAEIRAERPVPTHKEIADHFGFKSTRAAACHLEALKKKGALASEARKARTLRILNPLHKLRKMVVDIPLFGSIPAGFGESREQEADGCVSVDIGSVGFKPTKNTFALRVSGESMIGKYICNGDVILLEHGPEPRNGQIVAALIDGASTLKTFVVKGGKPYLKAENPKFPNLIPAHELMIQGVFKALIRQERE